MSDEATLRIVLQEEGGLNPESRPAPSRLLDPSTPNQPSVQMASRNPPSTYTAPPPTAQPPEFANDLKDALVAVGYAKKEAESLVDQVMRSGQTFATVMEAVVAVANKNIQPLVNAPPRPANQATQSQPQAGSTGFDPVAEAQKRREAEMRRQQIETEYQNLYPTPAPTFDPVAEAQKRLELDRQRAAIDAEYAKLNPPAIVAFDPIKEAQKRLEADKRRQEIDAEYAKLNPAAPEVFDPFVEAQKRIDAESKRQQVQQTYEQLNPKQPEAAFDPTKEAEKRREAEARKAQIDQAYNNMYGTAKRTESVFDEAFSLAKTLRGSIGGAFGTIFGAALDIWAIFDERDKKEREAAEQLALANFQVSKPIQTAPTVPQPTPATVAPSIQPVQPQASTPAQPQSAQVNQPTQAAQQTTQTAQQAATPTQPAAKTQLAPSQSQPAPKTQLASPSTPTQPMPKTTAPQPQPAAAKPPMPAPATAASGTSGAAASAATSSAGSAIAAAAGPVAIIMAVKEISDALISGTRSFVNNVQSLASNFVSADASVSTSIETVGKATESVSNKFGILGAAVNQSITSFGAFMRTLDSVADRYANLSPDIAVAQSLAEVRQVMGDFQRAQRIGPQLARYIQQQSEVQQRFEDIKIKLLMAIMPAVTKILELIEAGLPVIDTGVTAVTTFTNVTTSPILELVTIIRNIQRLLSGQSDEPPPDDPTTTILRLFGPGSMVIPNNTATV